MFYSPNSVNQLLFNDCKQIVFFHDEEFVAINLDGLAAVLAKQDAVADLDAHRAEFALVVLLAGADGQHFTLIGFFCGAVRNDDARSGLGFVFDALDDRGLPKDEGS